MKKIFMLLVISVLLSANAQAQLGGLVSKTLQKTSEKVSSAAADAVTKRLGLKANTKNTSNNNVTAPSFNNTTAVEGQEEMPTMREILAQMPELPTAAQLVSYKEATLRNQSFKLLASPVTMFMTNVYTLGASATGVAYSSLDTNAFKNSLAAMYGLSPAEMAALENMSDEEQEAFIMAHYQSGRADQIAAENAAKAAEMATLVEPFTNKIDEIEKQVEEIYSNAQKAMLPIYMKYKTKLTDANGNENIDQVIKYYGEIAEIQRTAVQSAMALRLKEQLPVAEKADETIATAQKLNPGASNGLMNYTALFAQSYFAEVSHLTDVPMYLDEQ